MRTKIVAFCAMLLPIFLTMLAIVQNTPFSIISNATTQSSNSSINQTTYFIESGLPSNALWSVVYNNITANSTTNLISFSTAPGNYTFSIPNVMISNFMTSTEYVPNPVNGVLQAGITETIKFIPMNSSTISTSISSTSTTSALTTATTTVSIDSTLKYKNGENYGVVAVNGGRIKLFTNHSVLKSITINLSVGSMQINISITNQSQVPSYLSQPMMKFYQYIQINGSVGTSKIDIDQYVKNATYNFSVPISWVQSENTNSESIGLFKYSATSQTWDLLPTSFIGSNSTTYFYSATSNSFSGYVVSYTTNSVTGTSSPIRTWLVGNYSTYFWAGASAAHASTATSASGNWLVSVSAFYQAGTGTGRRYNASSIGYNTISAPGTWTFAGTGYGAVVSGFAANVIYANMQSGSPYTTSTNTVNSLTTTFTVSTSNSFVILAFASGGAILKTFSTNAPNSYIAVNTVSGTYAQSVILTMNNIAAGTYNAFEQSTKRGLPALTIAAYVWNPYAVTLNDDPTSGTITTNGTTHINGNTIKVIGTNTVTANPPTGYIFDHWTPNPTSNIIIANTQANPTTLTVEGTGTLTANYALSSVTISDPSNSVVDVGQYESFTATVYNGVANYAYAFNVVNSVTLGTITHQQTYTGVSSVTQVYSFQITSADTYNSPEKANVIVSDSMPNTYNSVYSPTFTINPALVTGTITPSNPTIDNGQSITLTANPSDGSTPYTYQWYSSTVGDPACNAANVISGQTSRAYSPSPTQTTYYTYQVTDSATTNSVGCSASVTITVNSALLAGDITPSNPTIGIGQSVTLTANPSDGTTPYTYQWYSGTNSICTSDNAIADATSNTYLASPTSTTYYCYIISDSSALIKSIASQNGASIDTSTSEFGGMSGNFIASDSMYLSIPDSNEWYFGTGDFTIDLWVRFNSLPTVGSYMAIVGQYQDGNNWWALDLKGDTGGVNYDLDFKNLQAGSFTIDDGVTITSGLSTNTWYHFAVARSGDGIHFFLNGIQPSGSPNAETGAVSDFTGSLNIGGSMTGTGINDFDGWQDELRISKGIARWTANFITPSTAYITDQYTVLLMHMDGTNGATTFLDSSSSANSVTDLVTVGATCIPILSNTLITFPQTPPGSFASTSNVETITNAGTSASNILVNGGDWAYASNSFAVSNTLWSATSGGNIGTQLIYSAVDTLIKVLAGGTNTIYFGINIPTAQPAGTYAETINVLLSC